MNRSNNSAMKKGNQTRLCIKLEVTCLLISSWCYYSSIIRKGCTCLIGWTIVNIIMARHSRYCVS